MAAVLVGQFHARDAEGRVYSVHEFETVVEGHSLTTYKLAIGDRVTKINDNEFELIQSKTLLTRDSETAAAKKTDALVTPE
ncbi:hypothetical protein NTD86_16145 [Pseudomonas sp. 7P_10.2_Bac1]|uniref:hypothetical protein n=1 Tax=Pseudomonas sp. 7P_10.2_Bac1 TaxID=2971614 RepID=UPI0021C8A508|nr:hypothetical protein [Pseudomonas sp. 7P_10.2_Bac1]MCU1728518.1 hypothetical protein [Pseudomonas sp. 7P_10.2_Bac1]